MASRQLIIIFLFIAFILVSSFIVIQVLPLPHCKHLVNSANLIDYKFIGKLELCAGKKKKFKETEIYKKENDEFKLQGTVPNYFGNFFFL